MYGGILANGDFMIVLSEWTAQYMRTLLPEAGISGRDK